VTGAPGEGVTGGELAALREAFPGYRFRRRDFRGVPCYLAEARDAAEAPLAAARSPAVLADMLAAAAGRPVRLRSAAVAAAYRDRPMTMQQCAAMFGVSRTTIMKFLTAEGVALRRPGAGVDDRAVVTAYRDEGLSLHDCAARFGISQRRVAAALDRRGVPRRPVGRPPQRVRDAPASADDRTPAGLSARQGSRASSFSATSVRSSPITSGGSNGAP
jgi:hypothetical protein